MLANCCACSDVRGGEGVAVPPGTVAADVVTGAAGVVDAGEVGPPAVAPVVAVEGAGVGDAEDVDFPDPQATDTSASAGKMARHTRIIVFTALSHSLARRLSSSAADAAVGNTQYR